MCVYLKSGTHLVVIQISCINRVGSSLSLCASPKIWERSGREGKAWKGRIQGQIYVMWIEIYIPLITLTHTLYTYAQLNILKGYRVLLKLFMRLTKNSRKIIKRKMFLKGRGKLWMWLLFRLCGVKDKNNK